MYNTVFNKVSTGKMKQRGWTVGTVGFPTTSLNHTEIRADISSSTFYLYLGYSPSLFCSVFLTSPSLFLVTRCVFESFISVKLLHLS